nr:hypothetical protein [Janibacter endophyticus]
MGRCTGSGPTDDHEEDRMSKRGRKRRSRKGKAANHGRRPNA